jgi:hypothetical protein
MAASPYIAAIQLPREGFVSDHIFSQFNSRIFGQTESKSAAIVDMLKRSVSDGEIAEQLQVSKTAISQVKRTLAPTDGDGRREMNVSDREKTGTDHENGLKV